MGALEYIRKTNKFGVALILFGLIGISFVFGSLEILEDEPAAFMYIVFGAAILGMCAVNFFLAKGESKEDYNFANILAWAAFIILAVFFGAQIYAEEFSNGELRVSEETAGLGLIACGLACIAAMIVPAKLAITGGGTLPAGEKAKVAKQKTAALTAKGQKPKKPAVASGSGSGVLEAIALPFRKVTNLVISFVLAATGTLVLIPGLPLQGHIVRTAKQSYEAGKFVLPAWDDWGDLFKKGFGAAVIAAIFLIPIAVYSMGFVSNLGFPEEDLEKPGAMVGGLWVMVANDPVFGVLALVIEYVLAMALVLYAVKGSVGAAFNFGEIFRCIFTVDYFKAWLVPAIYLFVLLFVVSAVFTPVIGGFIESVEEEGDPEWEDINSLMGLGAVYFVFQFYAVYLATVAQTAAIALAYRKLEKG